MAKRHLSLAGDQKSLVISSLKTAAKENLGMALEAPGFKPRSTRLMMKRNMQLGGLILLAFFCLQPFGAHASEADITIPSVTSVSFNLFGSSVSGMAIMIFGILVCFGAMAFGVVQYQKTRALPVHSSMLAVSDTIWETCKTYLFTQGKFLAYLWALIAVCMVYYFGF